MNLKNRITKLENVTNINSEFCRCFGLQTEIDVRSSDAKESALKGSPIPDYCDKCEKPIKSERIIIQGV